jgi:hypothetical protein
LLLQYLLALITLLSLAVEVVAREVARVTVALVVAALVVIVHLLALL